MTPRLLASLALLLGAVWAAPAPAAAQETRGASIAAEQADKAAQLAPYKPLWVEDLISSWRQSLLVQPSGFYPYFDTVYSGGGFTLGAGYRRYTGDRTHWNVAGLYSVKGYKLVEAGAVSPGLLSGHLDLHGLVSWRDATQVNYNGLGIDSSDTDTAYRMQQATMGGGVTARPGRGWLFTAAAAVEDYTLKEPTGSATSVEDAFTPDNAPGVGVNPTYLHTTTAAAFDWRPAADYARRGGLYRIARHHYADRAETYSFSRVDTEVVQHLPILRETWVLSLRGRLETTLGDDDQVPYFMLPSLGSGSSLRGYSSWRFRDRHGVLLSGEWRWIANRMALDMALFYDTGMVASRLDALTLHSFVSDVGIGVRFHAPARTPLRIELARGSEGTRLVFSASSAF